MTISDPKYQDGAPPEPVDLPDDVIISSDTRREERIPPGQSRTKKWPVLQAGSVPQVSTDQWTLTVDGLVDRPLSFTWDEFQQLPRVKVFSDFHCVTKWSRLGNLWEGVSTKTIFEMAGVQAEAKFVVAGGYDRGWTTNLPLEHFLSPDALLCDLHDGEPLSADHGAPVRLIVPLLYAWKSAKWLKSLTFVAEDQPGYWEQGGYHNIGDPWLEQRFGSDSIPPGYDS
ncbi:sulfite oxidase-like oxidoreductase [Rubinisphaera margarita]|uniref:sulfite oxidase-like oxidoreductase n=1 Tax=Rubinisphaera margarita TaxID=2909586 RepID=UPI001EE785A6|nr:sulfite oxidase-like oxidoreductase [Rubinisphaera margarita]MCG6157601.1 sulfite oxidase-like oxidoreductase [Rubinisphaera margarita]